MVTGVLAGPPRVADADDAAGQEAGEPVVRGARGQHLAVRRLVREEGDLGQEDAERRRHQQLEPAVAEQDESGDRTAEAEDEERSDKGVEPGRAGEETGLLHDARHVGVGAGHRGELRRPGVGLTDGTEPGLEGGGGDESTCFGL